MNIGAVQRADLDTATAAVAGSPPRTVASSRTDDAAGWRAASVARPMAVSRSVTVPLVAAARE